MILLFVITAHRLFYY